MGREEDPPRQEHSADRVRTLGEVGHAAIGPPGRGVELAGHAHAERLVRPLVVVAFKEGIKASLLLEEIGRRRLGRFGLERQMHALVPAVLLRMPELDASDLNPEAEPPDGEPAPVLVTTHTIQTFRSAGGGLARAVDAGIADSRCT